MDGLRKEKCSDQKIESFALPEALDTGGGSARFCELPDRRT